MKSKKFNILYVAVPALLVFAVLFVMKGRAGNLEPNAPPGPTMVTLSYLSSQIAAISSPVEKIVRGVITLPVSDTDEHAVEGEGGLPVTIDPNHCVVMLSDAVASYHSGDGNYWRGRNGAYLASLTTTKIMVRAEGLRDVTQTVSYQIIVYK
jgi:hypothetical protein